MSTLIALFLSVLLADAPTTKPAELSPDLRKLQGEWSMVSGEREGEAIPADYIAMGKRVVKGDDLTVTFGDEIFMKAKIKLDDSKTPKTIDYDVKEGAAAGKTQLGIYTFDGENVKFCFSEPGKDRPAEFKTASGDGRILSVWKPAKK